MLSQVLAIQENNSNMEHANLMPRDLSFHILKEITNDFSEERKIGSGAFGKVYMGVFKNGEKIAVKVLYDMPALDDNGKQFQKEFDNIRCLQHQNIVRLVGYCYETRRICTDYNGTQVLAAITDRALCFEYMHNGSLDKYLYDVCSGHAWDTRFGIIRGICQGLKYLHEELETPIYHLDLKPANILLDNNMEPKITDFGLSRFFIENNTLITKNPIGTPGYMPPEYIHGAEISSKFDIYSLGAVIIKIMTGPKSYFSRAEMSSDEFIEHVHGNWRSRLQATVAMHELEPSFKQVKRCIKIALSCLEAERRKRPTIGDIVDKLNETMIQLPNVLRNDQGSSMDQKLPIPGNESGPVYQAIESQRERAENCFGEVVDNYKLDEMVRYVGKPKTQEDRARQAWCLINNGDKKGEASRYVDDLKALYGNGQSTLCLVYNATGDTLYYVANHDWYGYIGSKVGYPAEIGNGQWAAFHHVHRLSEPSGSMGAVVYRGKKRDGQDRDYLLAWSTPWGFYYRNKAYGEIGGVDSFQRHWDTIYNKLINSDYSSNTKSGGCEIEAQIDKGDSPKFTATIKTEHGL